MAKKDVQGEGNYTASRDYYAGVKKFVESGRVDAAAREAAPKTPAEAAELRQAEETAARRSKSGSSGRRKGPPVKEPDAPQAPVDEPAEEPSEEGTSHRPGHGPDRR